VAPEGTTVLRSYSHFRKMHPPQGELADCDEVARDPRQLSREARRHHPATTGRVLELIMQL